MDGRILILDYSEFEREKIRYLLRLIGDFDVNVIPSINEYYSQMDSISGISLIIMDIAFPNEKEGFEILKALKKGTCKNVPVIIVTKSEHLEYRDMAAGIGVNDYIVKPYNSSRLESSIRSFIKIEDKFNYDISRINNVSMSFQQFIETQIYLADAVKQPLSILVISVLGSSDPGLLLDDKFLKKRDLLCAAAIDTIKPMLSMTDVVVTNQNKEILVVLPLTDSAYAKLCKEKVIESISAELEKTGEKYSEHFYTVSVTYPEEGKDFQSMMKCAFSKITDRDLHEKYGMITHETKQYAKNMYNKYSRWF